MRSNSLFSLVFAALLIALASTASAQTTYAVVTLPKAATTNSAASAPQAPTHELTQPEVTTLAWTSEKLTAESYQAMFRADAFVLLNQTLAIQAHTSQPTMTADESVLFQAIRSGSAANFSLAEVSLVVSGVHDPARRQHYLAKIDEICAAAKEKADKQTTIKDKSQAIIDYLLAGPMKAGYEDNQYNMARLLDTGHFNCVSSVVMFNIVAHRLGIDVGAVVQSGHVFSRVPGYDVQTTSAEVYSSDKRLEAVRKNMERFKTPLQGFDPDHPYHEVGDYGVVLCMYQNIMSIDTEAKKCDEAVIAALKQACLDPTEPTAGKDLETRFKEWFNNSTTTHDLATARAIATLYRQIARDPSMADKMDGCVANAVRQFASR
jgi:hypothetical protein